MNLMVGINQKSIIEMHTKKRKEFKLNYYRWSSNHKRAKEGIKRITITRKPSSATSFRANNGTNF